MFASCPPVDGPKGLGTKLPAKKDAKKAAAGAAGSPLASATPGGSKAGASGEASSKKERGPLVAVQAKSLEVGWPVTMDYIRMKSLK